MSTSHLSQPRELKHDFRVHPSVLRYALPLSKLTRFYLHKGTEIWVGLIIVGKNDNPNTTERSPTALLVRPLQSTLKTSLTSPTIPKLSDQIIHPTSDGWDIPSLRAILGTDQTLLEAVNRCAHLATSQGVKEIVRCLGSAVDPLYSEGKDTGRQARRYDFLVRLHPGPLSFLEGSEGKWVSAEEGWKVIKRSDEALES
jgi:hypothetical protein